MVVLPSLLAVYGGFDWLTARWDNCFGGYVVVILGLNI